MNKKNANWRKEKWKNTSLSASNINEYMIDLRDTTKSPHVTQSVAFNKNDAFQMFLLSKVLTSQISFSGLVKELLSKHFEGQMGKDYMRAEFESFQKAMQEGYAESTVKVAPVQEITAPQLEPEPEPELEPVEEIEEPEQEQQEETSIDVEEDVKAVEEPKRLRANKNLNSFIKPK